VQLNRREREREREREGVRERLAKRYSGDGVSGEGGGVLLDDIDHTYIFLL
jgi:hypothetical protein